MSCVHITIAIRISQRRFDALHYVLGPYSDPAHEMFTAFSNGIMTTSLQFPVKYADVVLQHTDSCGVKIRIKNVFLYNVRLFPSELLSFQGMCGN